MNSRFLIIISVLAIAISLIVGLVVFVIPTMDHTSEEYDRAYTSQFKKELPNFNKKVCEEFNGTPVDGKKCTFSSMDELVQYGTVVRNYDGNGYGEMEEYREYHCTEYNGTLDTKRKTCNDSEAACLVLDSDYISLPFSYRCESGEMPSCSVIIESQQGCIFENNDSSQLRENSGIGLISIGDDKYHAYIKGKHAQDVCRYLDIECDDDSTFQGLGFEEGNLITFNVHSKYEFRILDDILFLLNDGGTNSWTNISQYFRTIVPLEQKLSDENTVLFTPYAYEDVCGFAVTHEMRLDIIEKNAIFSNDHTPQLTLQPGEFTHVILSKWNSDKPQLKYWFQLDRGGQVSFNMDACDVKGDNISMGKPGPTYLKPSGEYPENTFDTVNVPGHPLVDKFTMEPVLDVDNCKRTAQYYTSMQSITMFTRENTNFDALWENQVFPLMDYCQDLGNFNMNVIYGKIEWSFTVK